MKDQATIMNLVMGAKEGNFEVYIWKLIGNSKHLGQVRIESVRRTRKDFCIIPAEGHDRIVQDLMSNQSHIDIYIPDSALLLRCQVKQGDAPFRYYLHLPAFVAQVDRRKHLRLNVQDTDEVRVSFAKTTVLQKPMTQTFMKNCFDVSAGGVSFYISKMESKFFREGDSIPLMEVKAGNWSATLKAEVIRIREVDPDEYNGLSYKVWRVCCRFSQIDQISKKYLDRFILERIKDELHVINE